MNMNGSKYKHQKGAALVVSLVMLLVLTLLAITTMSTASLEVAMAGNHQYQENAFQLAETGNDVFLTRAFNNTDCIDTEAPGLCDFDEDIEEMNGNMTVTTTNQSPVNPPPCPGSSQDKYAAYQFQTVSAGTTFARDASSVHTQGWYRCGPSL
jgi:type IV pilus assembly protein PilX